MLHVYLEVYKTNKSLKMPKGMQCNDQRENRQKDNQWSKKQILHIKLIKD